LIDQQDAQKRAASLIMNFARGTDEEATLTGKSAAQAIMRDFILIKRSDLPEVESKAQGWGNLDVPMARTAGYRGRNPKMYWDRALDFISVALYAEQEEGKQAERELAAKRMDAYSLLFPKSAKLWDYSALLEPTKTQVDVVVKLMTQVDELKDSK